MSNSIIGDLKDVEELILETKMLQEKYPSYKKELLIGLISLEELKKEMQSAIKKSKMDNIKHKDFNDLTITECKELLKQYDHENKLFKNLIQQILYEIETHKSPQEQYCTIKIQIPLKDKEMFKELMKYE